ncbi:uncharacterized protein K02A2.6-like [Eupeodes corollae]|uniref:uncharacterized protein K02A2.6-like n=1 Tax=Eupeodes corollae TaxID=290404 RepID=UPI00249084CA|nr:uncharacterized protein K02A2.6-like [Eupeodes corollae]
MGYTYTIRYRPTTKHGNADCLSRLPAGPDEEFHKSEESCHQVDDSISALEDFPINSYVIEKFSKNDPDICKVIEYIQQGWPARLPATQNSLLPYFRRRLCVSVSSNILLFQSQSPRVVIPSALQPKVLTLLHQGHWEVTRMKQMARRYCWWPKVDDIIESTVAKCIACQSNANRSPKEYSSWTTSENVWERIHIDFAGPFQKSMWLIVVDSNSRFPFVIRMSSTTSQATIHALRSIFALEGLPKVIVSDNGTQFTSKEFQQFCQDHSILHMTSAPFNPESNGLAERMTHECCSEQGQRSLRINETTVSQQPALSQSEGNLEHIPHTADDRLWLSSCLVQHCPFPNGELSDDSVQVYMEHLNLLMFITMKSKLGHIQLGSNQ